MTSEEARRMTGTDFSTNGWLREICILLAQLVEQHSTEPKAPAKPAQRAR